MEGAEGGGFSGWTFKVVATIGIAAGGPPSSVKVR
jgi:hypothetical protein